MNFEFWVFGEDEQRRKKWMIFIEGSIQMIICKRLINPDDHLQEASYQDDHLQEASRSG